MKSLTAAAKLRITEDWLQLFPGLGRYRPLHLLRRVGPLLEGIALERDSGNDVYRPTFHVHGLVSDWPDVTLTLMQRLRSDRTGGPDFIQVAHHDARYAEAAERLRRQAPLRLDGELALGEVVDAYRAFHARPGVHYDAHLLFADMALICGWAGQRDRARALIAEGAQAMEQWPEGARHQVGGVEAWRRRLEEAVADPARLRAAADEHASALHAEALPRAELVG